MTPEVASGACGCIRNLNMTATTRAILQSLAATDPDLSEGEKGMLRRLVSGEAEQAPAAKAWADAPLLLTQKQAAWSLGISRVTLWRMTKEAVFAPVEITPGNFRYRREEIEAVARKGRNATIPQRVGRPCAITRPAL